MNILNFKTLAVIFLGLFMMAFQGVVNSAENEEMTAWVMVGDSPLLDRSSKSLFKDNYSAGIKYAKKALARSQSPYTQIIAQHNLCIAYTKSGDTALAESHCDLAQNSTIDQTFLKQIKPGLYKVVRNRGKADLPVLQELFAQNMRIEGIDVSMDRLAKAN